MAEAPRIPKEELKEHLDDPDIAIIDVRRDQEESDIKIKNAVLENPDTVDTWAETYTDAPLIVLYCS